MNDTVSSVNTTNSLNSVNSLAMLNTGNSISIKIDITERIPAFEAFLFEDEKTVGTIEKYRRDVTAFAGWLGERELNKENLVAWKQYLTDGRYEPATVNAIISSVNTFLKFLGLGDLRVRQLKVQRPLFRPRKRNLTRGEYDRMKEAAERRGDRKLFLLLETLGSTGMRVSELKHVTVEAINKEMVEIHLKAKTRTIPISGKLCRKLRDYCKKHKITSGQVFLSKRGKPLDRRRIWAMMKSVCEESKVEETKVFPHNLRHLFAREFYKHHRNLSGLADILGHSSIETTRIYLISTMEKTARELDVLKLVS